MVFTSASMGHFVAGEEMGHFVAGTICRMGRKRDILSSGTICCPKIAVGQFVIGTKCLLTDNKGLAPYRWILLAERNIILASHWSIFSLLQY